MPNPENPAVSGNPEDNLAALLELAADRDEPLHPDLVPYIEEGGPFGSMIRHPLVYDLFMGLPGLVNRQYEQKKELLAEAVADENWHQVVFLHERPYRLKALIDYVTGYDEDGDIITLDPVTDSQDTLDLVADVWVDSENIEQVIEDWRMLFGHAHGLWLGNPAEREQFDALERYEHESLGPLVKAWRGGVVGDWSWTTNRETAEFFARRSGYPVRGAMIPVSDVFGYLTRRSEAELLVKFTDFRKSLVYPDKYERTTGW